MIYIYIYNWWYFYLYVYIHIYIYNYIYMTSGFEVSKAFWQKIVSPCVTAGYYTWCSTMGFAWIPWYTTLIVIIGVKPICAIPQSPSTTADSRHCSRVQCCSESCSGCRLLVILVCLSWCRGWDLMAGKSFPVSRDFRFRSIRHLGNIESAWINDHLFWMHKTRNAAIQSHSRSWLIALPISFWAACRASIGLALVTTRMSHGIAPMIKSRSQEEQEKNTSNTKDLYGILWPWNPAIHPTSPLRLSIQATHTWLQLQQPSWRMIMLYIMPYDSIRCYITLQLETMPWPGSIGSCFSCCLLVSWGQAAPPTACQISSRRDFAQVWQVTEQASLVRELWSDMK